MIRFAAVLPLLFAAAVAAQETPVRVGSKNFTESRLLGEIMAQLLEARTDLVVRRRLNLGGTLVAFSALQAGEIDLYADYTGTGWAVVLRRSERASDPLRVFLEVADAYEKRWGIVWLNPFGFSNSYALALRGDLARKLEVERISDLVGRDGELRVGLSHEFLDREDGWPGLSRHYGLEPGTIFGMEHGLAFEAVDSGRLDVIDAWTTDAKLFEYDVRILEDDRGFFPPYDCAPLVRRELLERSPEVAKVLGELAWRLPDERMIGLNHAVEVEGRSFSDVARSFLVEEGLIDGAAGAEDLGPRRGRGFWRLMSDRAGITLDLAGRHLFLTLISVLAATLIAVPLGVVLARREALAEPLIGATGLIQTVPSLALLAFMIPLPGLGLGVRSALAALFLYALLPILRNTYTGLREVDPAVIDAARGIGLDRRQRLLRIELPLAARTIMAGIRTATVIGVGIATLAAFIGAGGLGDPIVTGLQLNDTDLILTGAVPAAVLAVLADRGLGLAEKLMAPRI